MNQSKEKLTDQKLESDSVKFKVDCTVRESVLQWRWSKNVAQGTLEVTSDAIIFTSLDRSERNFSYGFDELKGISQMGADIYLSVQNGQRRIIGFASEAEAMSELAPAIPAALIPGAIGLGTVRKANRKLEQLSFLKGVEIFQDLLESQGVIVNRWYVRGEAKNDGEKHFDRMLLYSFLSLPLFLATLGVFQKWYEREPAPASTHLPVVALAALMGFMIVRSYRKFKKYLWF